MISLSLVNGTVKFLFVQLLKQIVSAAFVFCCQQLDSNWMMAAETIMIMIVFKVAIVVQKKKMNLKQTKFNAFR